MRGDVDGLVWTGTMTGVNEERRSSKNIDFCHTMPLVGWLGDGENVKLPLTVVRARCQQDERAVSAGYAYVELRSTEGTG